MRFKSILLCAGVAPLLLGAAKPVRLQPSSPWVIDYAENSCRLVRMFGHDKTLTKLSFESPAPRGMDMLAIGEPLTTFSDKVEGKFLPAGGKISDGTVAKSAADGHTAILWGHVRMLPDNLAAKLDKEDDERKRNPGVRPPPISLAEQAYRRAQRHQFATAATAVEIDTRRNRPVILETGSLGDAVAAFDKCTRDSLRDWGVDPDLQDKIVRPPWAPDPSRWFSSNDYPNSMINALKESEVRVRLLVDASGNVTKCTSLSHYKSPEFNRAVCDGL
jgi:hypothetical protein